MLAFSTSLVNAHFTHNLNSNFILHFRDHKSVKLTHRVEPVLRKGMEGRNEYIMPAGSRIRGRKRQRPFRRRCLSGPGLFQECRFVFLLFSAAFSSSHTKIDELFLEIIFLD